MYPSGTGIAARAYNRAIREIEIFFQNTRREPDIVYMSEPLARLLMAIPFIDGEHLGMRDAPQTFFGIPVRIDYEFKNKYAFHIGGRTVVVYDPEWDRVDK